MTTELQTRLRDLFYAHPGPIPVYLCISCENPRRLCYVEVQCCRIAPVPELLEQIEALLGEKSYKLKPNKVVPEPRKNSWKSQPEQTTGNVPA